MRLSDHSCTALLLVFNQWFNKNKVVTNF